TALSLALLAGGSFALLAVQPDTGFDRVWLGFVLLGVGAGIIAGPQTSAAVAAVGPQRAGMASSAVNMFRQLGNVLGPAVLATIATSRFPLKLNQELITADVPAPTAAQITQAASH